jgi:hypothetical protein
MHDSTENQSNAQVEVEALPLLTKESCITNSISHGIHRMAQKIQHAGRLTSEKRLGETRGSGRFSPTVAYPLLLKTLHLAVSVESARLDDPGELCPPEAAQKRKQTGPM